MMKGMYITSDYSLMTESDVITWLRYEISNKPSLNKESFDDITGGPSEFIEKEDYDRIKKIFENLIDNDVYKTIREVKNK